MTECKGVPSDKSPGETTEFGEGYRWEGEDPEMLAAVVEAAFDYRGNVTILLRSGEEVVGYLANRDREASEPFVDILPADGTPRSRLPYQSLRGIVFSGRDTASGKSWESWVKKYEEKKKARERGEQVGDIGLFPEPLE